MNDPIVEEVRRHRMEHTRKFGGDLKLICEDLRRIQRESGCRSFVGRRNCCRRYRIPRRAASGIAAVVARRGID